MKTAEHSAAQGVKKEDVKIGEYIEMGAGYFIQRRTHGWMGWDGGFGLPCDESEVDRLIIERRDTLLYPVDQH